MLELCRHTVRDIANDARMNELCEDGGLACEPHRVTLTDSREDLDSDQAAGREIAGPIHRPHAAGAGDQLDRKAVCEHVPRLHRPILALARPSRDPSATI